ncbi:MAG: hypothetical protein KI790_04465, partial [Cyclobacteriaceae bacterium]|nr:hypothetical protein [Cyclobacteriaceae bacterium HetDA_MAG_MS6]
FQTLAQDSLAGNLLVLGDRLELSDVDSERLLNFLDDGGQVLLGFHDTQGMLFDSMDVKAGGELFFYKGERFFSDTVQMMGALGSYQYPKDLVVSYIKLKEADTSWQVLLETGGLPLVISKGFGAGKLVLCSTPLIFTNFGMLYENSHELVAKVLSQLPAQQTRLYSYYQVGKPEPRTPLRYFLSQPALRWALYLGVFTLLVMLIIQARRRQRAIPLILPPENSTMEYVRTIGNLFFREGNHKLAADKLVAHFYSEIKRKYFLEPVFEESFYHQLAGKSGQTVTTVIKTFDLVQIVKNQQSVGLEVLTNLSKQIDEFK